MSTHAEIIELGMSRLGNRRSERIKADLVTEINRMFKRLSKQSFKPWFLMDINVLSFGIGESFKALPNDFSLEVEEARPFFTADGVITHLSKLPYTMLVGSDRNNLSQYALEGNNIHVRALPTQAIDINILYYKDAETPIADDGQEASNIWLVEAEDWVLNEAAARVARFHAVNSKLADELREDAKMFKQELYILHEARKHQNVDYFVGGATDGS